MSEMEVSQGSFEVSVSQAVLEAESNDARFETLCRAVVSHLEGGATILGTSVSWDRGRDGIGVGRARGIIVCASLRDDVDAKSLSDIQRVASTTKGVTELYFCSSQRLTEHRKDQIEAALNREFDEFGLQVTCLGSIQISELARQESKSLERLYGAEIRECIRTLTADPSDETEVRGLRLALLTAGSDDSHSIREAVYSQSILEVLADGTRKTLSTCSRQLAESLRLQRNIDVAAIYPHVEKLLKAGLITDDGGLYVISDSGKARLAEEKNHAAERLLSGRLAIQKELERAIGTKLQPDEFSRIWTVFENRMAHYFQSRGDAIVREISETLALDVAAEGGESSQSPLSFVDELADSVGATSTHPQRREELAQAVRDLFADRSGEAAQWLIRLCASFVAACALGLEYASGRAVSSLLARTVIVLDTDVVLSLLGEGEPEHSAAQTVVKRWTQIGGRVLVGDPVLQEAAYHAFIAQRDFDQVKHLLPGTSEDRLRIIENAFVRSFAEILAGGQAKMSDWNAYIKQFKGGTPYAFHAVYGHLSTEFSIRLLPPRPLAYAGLSDQVRLFLLGEAESKLYGGDFKRVRDKAARDAELYSSMVAYADTLRLTDPGATCLLVSSARRLASADVTFQRSGERQLIVSLASAAYLVSLLPNVTLGLGAMKAFLFDERRGRFSTTLERTLVRMIKSSKEVSIPFSKRGILMREMRDRLLRDAVDRGVPRSQRNFTSLEIEALKPTNETRTIELLGKALDTVVADSRLEIENRELRRRLKEAEERISNRRKN